MADNKKFNLEDNVLSDDDLNNVSGGYDDSFKCPHGFSMTERHINKTCRDLCDQTECPVKKGEIE